MLYSKIENKVMRTRDSAKELIQTSKRIFIAYAHGDMKFAKQVRAKIIKLKGKESISSIFLDQESLMPGEDVSPEVIDKALSASDLLIVICGENTARGVEVIREISRGLNLREQGSLNILPIVVKSHVKLPDALDFKIQAVFLTTLFPEIKWIRWGVITVITMLLAVSAYSVWNSMEAKKDTARKVISNNINHLKATSTGPLDISSPRLLSQWLQTATEIGDQELISRINTLGSRYPASSSLAVVPALRENPTGVIPVGFESKVLLAYDHCITVFDSMNPNNPSCLFEPKAGKIKQISQSPDGSKGYFSVQYKYFSDLEKVSLIEFYDGNPHYEDAIITGGEEQLFEIRFSDLSIQAVGMLSTLEFTPKHDMNMEETGIYEYSEMSSYDIDWDQFTQVDAALDERRIVEKYSLSPPSTVTYIGKSSDVKYKLFQAVEDATLSDQVEQAFNVFCVLIKPSGEDVIITTPVRYAPNAGHISFHDEPPPVAEMPVYSPAAASSDSSMVLLGKQMYKFDVPNNKYNPVYELEMENMVSAEFSSDNSILILKKENNDIVFVDSASGNILRSFLASGVSSSEWVGRTITEDASVAVLLNKSGDVSLWKINAFGPDGWAK